MLLNRWLGPAAEIMMDMGDSRNGSRVLDVAAGTGEQTLAIAQRSGDGGQVLATDSSPDVLRFASRAARLAGRNNVQTRVIDGEDIADILSEPFDAVISRAGLTYFPDQQKALKGAKHQLRDGGKIAAMVYKTADANPFFFHSRLNYSQSRQPAGTYAGRARASQPWN